MNNKKEVVRQLPKSKYLSLREFKVGAILKITEIPKKDKD